MFSHCKKHRLKADVFFIATHLRSFRTCPNYPLTAFISHKAEPRIYNVGYTGVAADPPEP